VYQYLCDANMRKLNREHNGHHGGGGISQQTGQELTSSR